MNRTGLWLVLFLALAASSRAEEAKEVPPIPTGLQWLQSDGAEREQSLVAALLAVRSSGVPMKGSYLEYDDGLRRHLMRHPELQQKNLTDALAGYVYETDPSARPVLDKFRVRGKTPG